MKLDSMDFILVITYLNTVPLIKKKKNGAYVIFFDEYHHIGTYWVALHVNNKSATYFDSFGVEHVPQEIKKFIDNKKIITNIFRMQA